jgi:hypothetical protein
VINFKTLAIAGTVLGSVVLACPSSSQAMPQAAPVKIDAASNDNLVQVYYRRYCRQGRCDVRYRHYGHYRESHPPYCPPEYGYYTPYYGADRPCKAYYRPGYYRYYPYYRYYFVF